MSRCLVTCKNRLDTDFLTTSLRSVQNYTKSLGVLSSRRNGLSAAQEAELVSTVELDDPLGRWGNVVVQEKLKAKSVHIPR